MLRNVIKYFSNKFSYTSCLLTICWLSYPYEPQSITAVRTGKLASYLTLVGYNYIVLARQYINYLTTQGLT
jgi:hypothetical protein